MRAHSDKHSNTLLMECKCTLHFWKQIWQHVSWEFKIVNYRFKDSVQFCCSVVSDSLWLCGLQHTRPPCPSPTPGACSNSCPSNQWGHPTISSSVIPFSSHLQSFPASVFFFPLSQPFALGGLPMKTQDWSPLGWTGWVSLQSKGLSRVFSSTTFKKHQL